MSSFTQPTINPGTGMIQEATWLENYYKDGTYGVRFPSGRVYPEDKVSLPPEDTGRSALDIEELVIDVGNGLCSSGGQPARGK